MVNKFKSLTIFEFQERFPDDGACYEYLTELKWGNGFVCPNCGHTQHSSSKELGAFMELVLEKSANIKTDKWRGYQPLTKDFINLKQVDSGKKGGNFPELHRAIMGF
jgi:predicted RNA-binding Zn-ribbon protein involved in translation (DUF1610 family)